MARHLLDPKYCFIEQSGHINADSFQILVILRVDDYLERFQYSVDNTCFRFYSLFHVPFLLCAHFWVT